MSEKITASATFDAPTMLVGFRWHWRAYRFKRLARLLIVILVTFFATRAMAGDGLSSVTLSSLIVGALAVGMSIGFWLERRKFVAGLKTSPCYGSSVEYVMDENNIKVTAPHTAAQLAWNAYFQSIITPDGVLLYQQKLIFNWLPKAAFASEAAYTRFMDLVAAKTKHSKLG